MDRCTNIYKENRAPNRVVYNASEWSIMLNTCSCQFVKAIQKKEWENYQWIWVTICLIKVGCLFLRLDSNEIESWQCGSVAITLVLLLKGHLQPFTQILRRVISGYFKKYPGYTESTEQFSVEQTGGWTTSSVNGQMEEELPAGLGPSRSISVHRRP